MSEHVLMAYKDAANLADPSLPGRFQLAEMLQQEGVRVAYSVGAEAAFDGRVVEAYDSIEDGLPAGGADHLALDGAVKVILNRADRSLKLRAQIDADIPISPMFNANKVRSLGHYKDRNHTQILEPLGIAIPTALISERTDAERFLEEHPHSKYIVKPNSGSGAKGVVTLQRQQVPEAFASDTYLSKPHLLQPYYNLSRPLPTEIRPFDAGSAEEFADAAASDKPKEVRMYGFYALGQILTFPVGRVVDNGDSWFFIDPESVPEDVHDITRQGMALAAQHTGAKALYGTLDWAYGGASGEDPRWLAVETNLRSPYVIGFDKHPEVAARVHQQYAQTIITAARGLAAAA
jgi:hypothetical protein